MRMIKGVLLLAIVDVLLGCASTIAVSDSRPLPLYVERTIVSPWGGTQTLVLSVSTEGQAISRMEMDRPFKTVSIDLTDAEAQKFRELEQAATLFSGQSWGVDTQYADVPLVTLRVREGHHLIMIVCSGNESFAHGARKRFMDYLDQIAEKMSPQKN